MSSESITERQKREKEYYDQYASSHVIKSEIDLNPIIGPMTGKETRPWNSYWAVYAFAIKNYVKGSRLLDFGSGPGENALRFSHIGYEVEGFDISDKNIEIAKSTFENYKREGSFQVAYAEKLPYEDNSFNLIVGVDILHHVDISQSIAECHRVLKNGGKAFFREPVEVSSLDYIRNTRLIKKIAPKDVSFENHITHDERKLNSLDEEIIRKQFPKLKKHYYSVFSRFDKFLRKDNNQKTSLLEKIDYILIKYIPFFKYLGGTIIYELEK